VSGVVMSRAFSGAEVTVVYAEAGTRPPPRHRRNVVVTSPERHERPARAADRGVGGAAHEGGAASEMRPRGKVACVAWGARV